MIDFDLFSTKMHFLYFCYHCFFSDHKHHMRTLDRKEESAHNKAYNAMKEIVKTKALGTLRNRYVIDLDIKGTANPNYRSTHLMARFENDDEPNKKKCSAKVALEVLADA